jgi:hypothetical protein
MGVHPGISKTIKVMAAGVTGPFAHNWNQPSPLSLKSPFASIAAVRVGFSAALRR